MSENNSFVFFPLRFFGCKFHLTLPCFFDLGLTCFLPIESQSVYFSILLQVLALGLLAVLQSMEVCKTTDQYTILDPSAVVLLPRSYSNICGLFCHIFLLSNNLFTRSLSFMLRHQSRVCTLVYFNMTHECRIWLYCILKGFNCDRRRYTVDIKLVSRL